MTTAPDVLTAAERIELRALVDTSSPAPRPLDTGACLPARWRRWVLDSPAPTTAAEIETRRALGPLSPGARRAVTVLAEHAEPSGTVRLGRRDHAKRAGLCHTRAATVVGRLIRAGLVARIEHSGRDGVPDTLRLCLPEHAH